MTNTDVSIPGPPPAVRQDIAIPPVNEVAPGVWAIPLPLTGNPLRYIVPYAIEVDGGLVMIDSGWNDEESWASFTAGLEQIGGSPRDIRAVLVTHAHPDHYGLAPRIRQASGGWVGLHSADRHMIAFSAPEANAMIDNQLGWLLAAGAPAHEIDQWHSEREAVYLTIRSTPPDRKISGGQMVRLPGLDLQAIHTPGHTDGHLCFVDGKRRVLFSGDHVLPVISPNITTMMSAAEDPLGDFLRSLSAVRDLPVDRALAAHVSVINDLPARVDELLEHHRHRLEEVLAIVVDGTETIWDIAMRQPWKRGWAGLQPFMRRAAVGEAHAHLLQLERRHLVQRSQRGVVQIWRPVEARSGTSLQRAS